MKNIKNIVILISFSALSLSLSAQQRTTEMEVIMEAPQDGSVFQEGDPIPFIVEIKNNGPDDLVTGDTLFVYLPNGQGTPVILSQGIENGNSVEIINTELTIEINEPTTGDICVQVVNDPTNQVTIGGNPVTISYADPDSTNNSVCHEITIEIEDPASIQEIKANTTTLSPYPNPAIDQIFIPLTPNVEKGVRIVVTDISGRIVFEESYKAARLIDKEQLRLSISGWKSGVYFIERWQGRNRAIGKVVISQD